MIRATSGWRTTSSAVKREKPTPGTSRSSRSASTRPEVTPRGRSICVTSPVTAIRLPSPSRVRNIFICIVVAFCASSSTTKALASVRPRMNASGAISICRSSISFCTCFAGKKSFRAS